MALLALMTRFSVEKNISRLKQLIGFLQNIDFHLQINIAGEVRLCRVFRSLPSHLSSHFRLPGGRSSVVSCGGLWGADWEMRRSLGEGERGEDLHHHLTTSCWFFPVARSGSPTPLYTHLATSQLRLTQSQLLSLIHPGLSQPVFGERKRVGAVILINNYHYTYN